MSSGAAAAPSRLSSSAAAAAPTTSPASELADSESSECPQPKRSVASAEGLVVGYSPGTPMPLPHGKMYPIMSSPSPSMNRYAVCMCGSSHGGSAYGFPDAHVTAGLGVPPQSPLAFGSGHGMSSGPRKLRRYVK